MDKPTGKLTYIDYREILLPNLKCYSGAILIKKGAVLNVTDAEKRRLLKMKNGKSPCYEDTENIKPSRKPREEAD